MNSVNFNFPPTIKYYFSAEKITKPDVLKEASNIAIKHSRPNLGELLKMGMPIPPSFIITRSFQEGYRKNGNRLDANAKDVLKAALKELGLFIGLDFFNPKRGFFLTVRGEDKQALSRLLPKFRDVGLVRGSLEQLARLCGDENYAWALYVQHIKDYGCRVLGCDAEELIKILYQLDFSKNGVEKRILDTNDYQKIATAYKGAIEKLLQNSLTDLASGVNPQDSKQKDKIAMLNVFDDPLGQFFSIIEAIYDTWQSKLVARLSDKSSAATNSQHNIAIHVQLMSYQNLNHKWAKGKVCSRKWSTGEDLIDGKVTLGWKEDNRIARRVNKSIYELVEHFPSEVNQLASVLKLLEHHFRNPQVIEFMLQEGRLQLFHVSNVKIPIKARLKVFYDMLDKGVISESHIWHRIDYREIKQLFSPVLSDHASKYRLAQGNSIGSGLAAGPLALTAKAVHKNYQLGINSVLIKKKLTADDFDLLDKVAAFLMIDDDFSNDFIARINILQIPCLIACSGIVIDLKELTLKASGRKLAEGDSLTVDANLGDIYSEEHPFLPFQPSRYLLHIANLINDYSSFKIYANFKSLEELRAALDFNCNGICFDNDHIWRKPHYVYKVQGLLLTDDHSVKQDILNSLLEYQTNDFVDLFRSSGNKPLHIKLLGLELSDFFSDHYQQTENLTNHLKIDPEQVTLKLKAMSRYQKGLSGCRLLFAHPQIYQIQVRALAKALIKVTLTQNIKPQVKVLIPDIMYAKEWRLAEDLLRSEIDRNLEKLKFKINLSLGVIINSPRAALVIEKLAVNCDFFCFDILSLSQKINRRDADFNYQLSEFYCKKGILDLRDLNAIDIPGVGSFIKQAVKKARRVNPNLTIGACNVLDCTLESVRFYRKTLKLDFLSVNYDQIFLTKLIDAQLNSK